MNLIVKKRVLIVFYPVVTKNVFSEPEAKREHFFLITTLVHYFWETGAGPVEIVWECSMKTLVTKY